MGYFLRVRCRVVSSIGKRQTFDAPTARPEQDFYGCNGDLFSLENGELREELIENRL